MTKITYRLVEMKTKYWCHKSEALKAIVIKTITYFHSGPRFFHIIPQYKMQKYYEETK